MPEMVQGSSQSSSNNMSPVSTPASTNLDQQAVLQLHAISSPSHILSKRSSELVGGALTKIPVPFGQSPPARKPVQVIIRILAT